jgi:hypothetical protein
MNNIIYTKPSRIFNIAFDIDNVLADFTVLDLNEIKFYQQRGFVLTAIKTHYIFPGVTELMQLLFRMPDVKVSFFSYGHQYRNELFAERLLKHALGEAYYLEIKENIQIFSGIKDNGCTDLIKPTSEEHVAQKDKYCLSFGNQKKSLEKVVGQDENLDDSVLIDDSSSWVKSGQERNYLHVPAIYNDHYEEMERESQYYSCDENGYWKISFRDCTSIPDKEYVKNLIMSASCIGFFIEKEKCTLGYIDYEQKHYKEIELTQVSDGSLLAAIKAHYQENGSAIEQQAEAGETMTKAELDLALYALLEEKQGKTTAIHLACNRICYVTGVLFKALEHARGGSTLAEFLFPLHFSAREESGTFEPRFQTEKAAHEKEEYYHYGLKKLQQANPHFTFITPQIYSKCCAVTISTEEEIVLQDIHKNEG